MTRPGPDQVFQVQLSGKVVGGLVVSERLEKGALRLASSHQAGQLCGQMWSVTSPPKKMSRHVAVESLASHRITLGH